MTFSIRNPRADALARELAKIDNRTITDAVIVALEETIANRRKHRDRGAATDSLLKRYGIELSASARKPVDPAAWRELSHDLPD
jgi:antitoxin VapB